MAQDATGSVSVVEKIRLKPEEEAMSNTLLYVITVVVWGSTWLAITFQLGEVAPEVSVAYRYAIASVILFAWCLIRGLRLHFNFHAHIRFILLGIFLFGLNYIGSYSAQQYISSALNAVAFSTMMWMNIINSRLFLGTVIEKKVYLGATLGVAGVITLFWPEISDLSLTDKTVLGASLCLGAAFVASLGNMISQTAQKKGLPVLQSNAWGMFYGALFTCLIANRRGLEFDFDWSAEYITSLLFLAVFGSIVAFGCYLKLLGRIGAHKAGYAVVMFPVVAVILSVLFEGLEMTPNIWLGLAFVLIGNVVILGFQVSRDTVKSWFVKKQVVPNRFLDTCS